MSTETLISQLQESFKAPKLDAGSAMLFKTESYLLNFGLSTKEELNRRHLGLVAMFPTEDPGRGTRYEEHLMKFYDLSIHEIFGETFESFIHKPRHRCEMMYKAAESIKKKRNQEGADVASELEKKMAQAGLAPKK